MSKALPEKTGTELLNDVVKLTSGKNQPSEIEIKRYKIMAHDIAKYDALNSYIILGIIGSLEKNPEESRSNHEKALKLAPHEIITTGNYAVSLHRLGFFDEALKYMRQASDLSNGTDTFSTAKLSLYALTNGLVHESLDIYHELLKLKPDSEYLHQVFYMELEDFLSEYEIEDRKTKILLNIVQNILNKRKVYDFNITHSVNSDESSSWLSWVIETQLNSEDVMHLNIDLSMKLAELDPSNIQSNVVARFQ